MTDLNKFLEITSLTENISYPSGYNVLEIIGTGDERPGSFDEPQGPGDRPTSGRTIDVEPLNSTIPWQGSTSMIIVGREEDGSGGEGVVSFTIPYGIGVVDPYEVTLGTKAFTGISVELTGHNSFNLPYPGLSVTAIDFLGTPYTALEITNGSTVTIVGTFGVTTGTATVDYTATGYGETTFYAPQTDISGEAYIVSEWSDAPPVTTVIVINENGLGPDGALSIEAENNSLAYGATTTLIITGDADVPDGAIVSLRSSSGIVEASTTLGDKGFPNATGKISGRSTFSVDYTIKSVSHISNVMSGSNSYSVIAVDGDTATINGSFPFVVGEVTCSYTASKYAEVSFTAPTETVECLIQAESASARPAACTISVSAEGEPDGYNWVTRPVFPTLKITGPVTMTSNGADVGSFTVDIYDPNSENPFLVQRGMFESCSVSGPQDFTTEYWITSISGCWEDQTKTLPIPVSSLVFNNNRVHIDDSFTADGAPDGWIGLYRPEVYLEYTGFLTLAVEDGLQTSARWWSRPGDDEGRTETDVSGTIYVDEAGLIINDNSEVPITNAAGQNTKVTFYYRPDAGEEGIAYLNAAYRDTSVTWPVSVICGSFAGASIAMTAEPSTIVPGGKSLLTFTAADSNGGALYGDADNPILVNFFVQSGNGNINPASAPLEHNTGKTEEVESDSLTEFSVSEPIIRITALSVIGDGTFVWNGQATVSGNSVTLVNQSFPLATSPLSVTYDWGGSAKVFYYAIGDVDKDVVYVGGRIDGSANTLCKIDISSEGGARDTTVDLSISAEDSSIPKDGSTAVTATAYKDDVAITSGLKFSVLPNRGTLTMSYDATAIVAEEGSISDRKSTSTNYAATSVSAVTFMGTPYPVEKVEGTSITMAGEGFPVASGTCLISYVPNGLWRGTYNAVNDDYTAHLNVIVYDELRTDVVTVGAGDGPITPDPPDDPPDDPPSDVGPDLTVSAEPTSINRGESSVVKAEVKLDGQAQSGESVSFTVISGPGQMSSDTSYSGSAGTCESVLETQETGPIGTTTINVTWGTITKSVEVSVKSEKSEDPQLENLPDILINGTIDPATKEVLISENVILRSLGAANEADEFGCIATDPLAMGPSALVVLDYYSPPISGWDIVDVVVTGALYSPVKDTTGEFRFDKLELKFPWIYGPNVARNQIVHVVDKIDETQPIVGATVTLGGSTALTDQAGTATFSGVAPGEYQIGITHPNYKDNRAGVAGGSGVADTDESNDSYTVQPYSTRRWILDKLAFTIKLQFRGYPLVRRIQQ